MSYLAPSEFVTKMVDAGESKIHMSTRDTLIRGYMAGAIKDFFDRTFYPAQDRVQGLPYAIFVSAGNDGTGAVGSIERIALGYRFRKCAEPLIIKGDPGAEDLQRCADLGQTLAAGLALGIL